MDGWMTFWALSSSVRMSSCWKQDGEQEEDEVEEQEELEEEDTRAESLKGGRSFSELFFLLWLPDRRGV